MDLLVESAVRITVLAIAVALVLRALRIRSPRLVHRAWTGVTVVMLLMPVFVASGPELSVPLLRSPVATGTAMSGAGATAAIESNGIQTAVLRSGDRPHTLLDRSIVALAVYGAGVTLFLLRLAIGWRRARGIRREAVQAHGQLTHPACVSPMTVGVIAPVVILPPDWTDWTEAELSAVLAHEYEHVRQRDSLVAVVALLNRAFFWFHPLAWWLQRTLAELSEQACDVAVVSRGHDRDVYSSCLLRFARRAARAGGRIAPMAPAMPGVGLRERLGMLARQLPSPTSRVRLTAAAVASVAVAIVCTVAMPAAAPAQNSRLDVGNQAAWPVERSAHFEIVHNNLLPDDVSHAVRDVEQAYGQLSSALKHEMPGPIRVILVRWEGDITAGAESGVAHIGRLPTREQRVVIAVESLDRRPGLVVHELSHLFAFEIVPETSRIAPVLIEGLAEHLRDAWRREDWQMMRAAAAAGAVPTMAALVNTDRHWAHAVFDFVAERHGEEGVRQLLFALRARHTLAPAVPMAFDMTFDQFDEEFRGYVTSTFGQP